jgi:hypothetical protein
MARPDGKSYTYFVLCESSGVGLPRLIASAMHAVPSAPGTDRALAEPFLQPALARIARSYRLTLI